MKSAPFYLVTKSSIRVLDQGLASVECCGYCLVSPGELQPGRVVCPHCSGVGIVLAGDDDPFASAEVQRLSAPKAQRVSAPIGSQTAQDALGGGQ